VIQAQRISDPLGDEMVRARSVAAGRKSAKTPKLRNSIQQDRLQPVWFKVVAGEKLVRCQLNSPLKKLKSCHSERSEESPFDLSSCGREETRRDSSLRSE
jgi:hypothetical protein